MAGCSLRPTPSPATHVTRLRPLVCLFMALCSLYGADGAPVSPSGSSGQSSGDSEVPIAVCQPYDYLGSGSGAASATPARSNYTEGDNVTLSCGVGHVWSSDKSTTTTSTTTTSINTTTLTCNGTGHWQFLDANLRTPTAACRPVQCPTPVPSPLLQVNTNSSSYHYQASVQFSCPAGFFLSGDTASRCLATGRWSHTFPLCHALDCSTKVEEDSSGGMASGTAGGNKSEAVCRCPSGYRATESSNDGATQGTVSTNITCEPIECPALGDLGNGTVTASGNGLNSTAQFRCNDGFTLQGPSRIVCRSDGQWTPSGPPSCVVGCREPSVIADGDYSGSYGVNGTVRYTCRRGYRLNITAGTAEVIACSSPGQWNAAAPACIPIACTAPVLMDRRLSVVVTGYAQNATTVFSCPAGYRASADQSVCTANATWSPVPARVLCSGHGPTTAASLTWLYITVPVILVTVAFLATVRVLSDVCSRARRKKRRNSHAHLIPPPPKKNGGKRSKRKQENSWLYDQRHDLRGMTIVRPGHGLQISPDNSGMTTVTSTSQVGVGHRSMTTAPSASTLETTLTYERSSLGDELDFNDDQLALFSNPKTGGEETENSLAMELNEIIRQRPHHSSDSDGESHRQLAAGEVGTLSTHGSQNTTLQRKHYLLARSAASTGATGNTSDVDSLHSMATAQGGAEPSNSPLRAQGAGNSSGGEKTPMKNRSASIMALIQRYDAHKWSANASDSPTAAAPARKLGTAVSMPAVATSSSSAANTPLFAKHSQVALAEARPPSANNLQAVAAGAADTPPSPKHAQVAKVAAGAASGSGGRKSSAPVPSLHHPALGDEYSDAYDTPDTLARQVTHDSPLVSSSSRQPSLKKRANSDILPPLPRHRQSMLAVSEDKRDSTISKDSLASSDGTDGPSKAPDGADVNPYEDLKAIRAELKVAGNLTGEKSLHEMLAETSDSEVDAVGYEQVARRQAEQSAASGGPGGGGASSKRKKILPYEDLRAIRQQLEMELQQDDDDLIPYAAVPRKLSKVGKSYEETYGADADDDDDDDFKPYARVPQRMSVISTDDRETIDTKSTFRSSFRRLFERASEDEGISTDGTTTTTRAAESEGSVTELPHLEVIIDQPHREGEKTPPYARVRVGSKKKKSSTTLPAGVARLMANRHDSRGTDSGISHDTSKRKTSSLHRETERRRALQEQWSSEESENDSGAKQSRKSMSLPFAKPAIASSSQDKSKASETDESKRNQNPPIVLGLLTPHPDRFDSTANTPELPRRTLSSRILDRPSRRNNYYDFDEL